MSKYTERKRASDCAKVISADREDYDIMLETLSAQTAPEQNPFWQALKRRYPEEHAPYPLILGVPSKRELASGEEVVLLTPLPVTQETVSLKLHKLGGSGRVSVTVCKVDRNGAASPVWWLELARSERSVGKIFTKQLEVSEHLLSVHLSVRGGGLVYKLHTE